MPVATRLALYYGCAFLLVGVQLPFWPLWLAGRGLSAGEIGFVLAFALLVKVAVNPLVGIAADRTGRRRAVIIALSVVTLAGFLLFFLADGFWAILVVNALTTSAASAIMPLGDNFALAISYDRQLDYGRIRLWGSVAFIGASLGAGALLVNRPGDIVLPLIIAAATVNLAACIQLPPHPFVRRGGGRGAWRILVLDRRSLLFLAAATAIQASHSVYYVFGTIYWKSLGYDGTAIGWLWSEGVVAEIGLFALGAPLVTRLGPTGLLVLAGIGGVARWSLTAVATELPALLALQLFHALTFGAAHLGAMHFMAKALPPELSASGTALYSAIVSGIGFGLIMAVSGPLYAAAGGNAYLAMGILAGLGALAAWRLGRIWIGERLSA